MVSIPHPLGEQHDRAAYLGFVDRKHRRGFRAQPEKFPTLSKVPSQRKRIDLHNQKILVPATDGMLIRQRGAIRQTSQYPLTLKLGSEAAYS